MPRNEIKIEVSADTKSAQNNLKALSDEGKRLDLNFKQIAIRAGIVGGAIAGVGLVAKSLVDTYLVQARAERTLAQVVSNTGEEYALVETRIKSLTAALQAKTNFGDEAQIQALTRMTIILGDVEKAQAALPSILDAAAASGRDLGTVSETLTKALAGQADTAESLGLKFDKAADFGERLAMVQNTVGGAAEANADPFVQLGNAMGDFQEVLGSLLAGPLTEAVQGMTAIVNGVSALVDVLAASNTMWDENGQRIKPVADDLRDYRDAIVSLVDPSLTVIDVGNGFVQFLTDEEVALRDVQASLNNYNVTAEQTAAINRENFEAQQRLAAIERDRATALAELNAEQEKARAEAEAQQIADLAKALEKQADAERKIKQEQIKSVLQFRKLAREREIAEQEASQRTKETASEVRILSQDLNDNADIIDQVNSIMAQAESGTLDWADAQRELRRLIPTVNSRIQAQTADLREQAREWNKVKRAILEAAEAQAQFAGRGPTSLPITREFVQPVATSLFESFGQRRLENIFRDFGLGEVNLDRFTEFFETTVQGFLSTSLDRSEALLRAVQQVETFQTGGVVPGPIGAPRMIMAHGGETVLPTHLSGQRDMGGVTVNFFGDINGSDEFRDELENIVEEAISRRSPAGARRRS